jgi:FkbM family methyltransferase
MDSPGRQPTVAATLVPVPYQAAPPAAPRANAVQRAIRAVFMEHRLPYRVRVPLDRCLNWIGLHEKTVKVKDLRVRVRRLSSDEMFVANVILNEEYTSGGFGIGATDTVIDIGGNIGTFALYASRMAHRGRVLTFEPSAANYRLLTTNIAMNKAANVTAERAAVSDSVGTATLYRGGRDGGFFSTEDLLHWDASNSEQVPTITLREIFDRYELERCDFLKLDCEGAEYRILYALPEKYFLRVSRIAMEWHGVDDEAERRDKAGALAAYLQTMGFRLDAFLEFTGFRSGHIRATNERTAQHRPT